MTEGAYTSPRRKNSTTEAAAPVGSKAATPRPGRMLTQHTGLPPRANGAGKPATGRGFAARKPGKKP